MRTLTAESDMLPHLKDAEFQRLRRERAAVTRRLTENGSEDPSFEAVVQYAEYLDDQIADCKQRCLEEVPQDEFIVLSDTDTQGRSGLRKECD